MSPITNTKAAEAQFTVGVALDGAGWHPAAWREPTARAAEIFSPEYWHDLIARADAAGIDYATIEDALRLQSADPFGRGAARGLPPRPAPAIVEGRLDALLVASWVAPRTRGIGLIPTVTTTHTEPFHVATALQTLDHISEGRAGWQLRFSAEAAAAAAFGRKPAPEIDAERIAAGEPDAGLDELIGEAGDAAESARRLWDSWEDDAVIRDVATGRFLDRDRVHHIDFAGERFSVIGPSIVPRSPQGQLPVTLLAHSAPVHALAARAADVVFVTPESPSVRAGASRDKPAAEVVAEVRAAEGAVDRAVLGLEPLRIVADLVVALDAAGERADERLRRLDALAGGGFESDAALAVGPAEQIAARIEEWRDAGVDGVRLRPLTLPGDLDAIADGLLPVLRARGLAGRAEAPRTLRERFGLPEAANRYATAPATAPATEEVAA
ncbi:LLM class flavin-dependent oxidoreductase [Leucobacter sp. wl10]|uniref:LLM class flavin-dependent oxidoreductase n=1 Tax=Leucobacter sp. wl10 TaxID=2304677 RepID=UPI000E5A7C51|nr:LLM class flavin-dependent oxidoreductase [Leucobacter sp. wl10]RGE20766.1 LLM class flavin-dependent oxidoreductase [Leucobacter sp. wl10]